MKTLHLAIIVSVIGFTMVISTAYAQYGSGFYPIVHYPATNNNTKLELVVMNSTEFKERTNSYNYTLAGIDYNWIPKGNNYYDFGGARVTFLVWGFGNATTKGESFNLDSEMRIKNVFEYNADRPPAGYPTSTCEGICVPWVNPTKPLAEPNHIISSPLKQFKSGILEKDVQCKNPLVLVISTHNTPACLNAIHLTILYSRGWVKDIVNAEKLFQLLPDTAAMNFFPHIRTNATVLIDKDINTTNVPLYIKSNNSQGISYIKTDKFGVESKIYDNKHLLLTFYKGNTTNYTIIAAKATNISPERITIRNFELDGSYWFPFDDSSSETPFLHTFPIGQKDNSQCNCFGNPYPTIDNPIVLEPHESVTAYVNGSFITRDLHLNKFSASVGYDFNELNKTNSFSTSSQFVDSTHHN
ncbi:MAG: hypothetical protein KGI25_08615 [Thaumarchaeota archaeon]|nr:hypothetical protein [Nitrososphaerota archaeon]